MDMSKPEQIEKRKRHMWDVIEAVEEKLEIVSKVKPPEPKTPEPKPKAPEPKPQQESGWFKRFFCDEDSF